MQLIEQFGAEEVLSNEVRGNTLLVFLLRRGYIDEKYANYINYFKGNTVTTDDMNYILSIKNKKSEPFYYPLTKTSMVAKKLQLHEFEEKEIYNFSLMECMLLDDADIEKRDAFIKQLTDEDPQSWTFIEEFVDLTKHQDRFIELLAPAWSNMWSYIAQHVVLTHERKVYYLALLLSNADVPTIALMNENNIMRSFIEESGDILQELTMIEDGKMIAVIEALHVIFRRVSTEGVSKAVLDYIFGNKCYELTPVMIERLVEYKNRDLVPELKSKNYSTVIKLGYAPLIEYVRENLEHYLETVVLTQEQSFDEEAQILDLLARSIDNFELCVKIIKHEEFCMTNITRCCIEQMETKKEAVKSLWDALLRHARVVPSWANTYKYWEAFGFGQNLLDFMKCHADTLISTDDGPLDDEFIRGFIESEADDELFGLLLPHIPMQSFDIPLASIPESKIFIMIHCRYFSFTISRYGEIEDAFPNLCTEFIMENQADYIGVIESIKMDSDLLESLLFDNQVQSATIKKLLDRYGAEHMTCKIAQNLQVLEAPMDLSIFNAAWVHLEEPLKKRLLLAHLELLDADTLHSCFSDLNVYSGFVDRSKKHVVKLEKTAENLRLTERLKAIHYITSYELKGKKEYDPVADREIMREVILCRVKSIKTDNQR